MRHQLFGGLFSHAWHARNVVRAITHQSQHVDDTLRSNPKTLPHLGDADTLVFHGVQDSDLVSHQLAEVLIATHQDHSTSLCLETPRQRAQDIIGFISCQTELGNVERFDQAMNVGHLHREFVWHGRAVGFVGGIHLVAKGRATFIKGHPQILRLSRPVSASATYS